MIRAVAQFSPGLLTAAAIEGRYDHKRDGHTGSDDEDYEEDVSIFLSYVFFVFFFFFFFSIAVFLGALP